MLRFADNNKGKRPRIKRLAMESHWDDFTKRIESALITVQIVSRAKADGTEHRFMRRASVCAI